MYPLQAGPGARHDATGTDRPDPSRPQQRIGDGRRPGGRL